MLVYVENHLPTVNLIIMKDLRALDHLSHIMQFPRARIIVIRIIMRTQVDRRIVVVEVVNDYPSIHSQRYYATLSVILIITLARNPRGSEQLEGLGNL